MKTNPARRIACITAVILCTIALCAAKSNKDHERVYQASFDPVWNACVQAANEKYTITYSDKTSGALAFKQGMSWKTNSYGMNVGVTVVAVNDKETRVIINPQKEKSQISWAGKSIDKKFFATVDKILKDSAPPSTPGK